ncbi:MAG TPA: haloacid dehalogenase type II [Acetobacteraceae bacterium]|jgi:2-haloacid dehalogenase|nr:haloacid dehalogenase type II [Acetobacteraceae bacterium]
MASVDVAVFDAYGTLLDLNSAVARHAERVGPDWERLNTDWRTKQTEYIWVRSLAGPAQHRDFAVLTEESLRYVAKRHGIEDQALIADLHGAYGDLAAYSDAAPMLRELRERGIGRAILSNGTPAMLDQNVRAAGLTGLLDDLLSVEAVGVYKPDPRVYRLVTERYKVQPQRVAFLSSNPWDAFGAMCFGFRVFWVNRRGLPVEYGLDRTATVITGFAELPDLLT